MGSPRGGGFHCHAQRDDLAGRFAAHDGVNVVGPALQGVASGLVHRIDLIDADDAAIRAASMVEHLLNRLGPDAEPLHAGGTRSPQIVPDERLRQRHDGVDFPLEAGEARQGRRSR